MSKKSPKIQSWIDAGIFPATIVFSCGFTYEENMELLKEKKSAGYAKAFKIQKDLMQTAKWLAFRSTIDGKGSDWDRAYFGIFIRECFDFSDASMCKLAHEIVHICQFMLPYILKRDEEIEAEAYLHTHFMMNILKLLRNKKPTT